MGKKVNTLSQQNSLYLRQHANNPVHWQTWEDVFNPENKSENRLLIISIGYSSCHWCHVMEHESFEDEQVAAFMNQHFVSIKVDREERPDIDHIYMQALQLLTGQGGWPLNIVALPDGRPVWGGTYFPKENWMDALTQLVKIQNEKPEKLLQYAEHLEQGIGEIELEKTQNSGTDHVDIQACINRLSSGIDKKNGGMQGAPKFMMPSLLQLFLTTLSLHKHGHYTLKKIALGGVFDVVRGGFSRYSVDDYWHVPHFEKMAYDNGQLLKVYAKAELSEKDPLYHEVIQKTWQFIQRELLSSKGGYFAAIDADSLNAENQTKEGAFYSWTLAELKALGLDQDKAFCAHYGIEDRAYWEEGQYVLFRSDRGEKTIEGLEEKCRSWEKQLFEAQEKRNRPLTDEKRICGWNALIGQGLIATAQCKSDPKYSLAAQNQLDFVFHHFQKKKGGLLRVNENPQHQISGFLEDYSQTISFYLDGYECFFDPQLLARAAQLIAYCFQFLSSDKTPLFRFSEKQTPVVQTHEINDNVIPSSNAVMAENLLRASTHLGRPEWKKHAQLMIQQILPSLEAHPRGYSHWLSIVISLNRTKKEIVVVGEEAKTWIKEFQKLPLLEVSWAASETKNENLPLLKNRFKAGKTALYLCENNSCLTPIFNYDEAFKKVTSLLSSSQ